MAILLVLFNHFLPNIDYAPSRTFQWLSNLAQSGWAGVDLFFVLSGYLITGILIRAKSKDRFFRTFCARRVLRIFPLYYFALLLTFVVFPLLPIVEWESFRPVWRGQLWSWLYATNLGSWSAPGHFTSDQVNLGHFWSLAVEEHFYIVWPAVVYLLPVRRLTWVSLGCVVFVPLLRTAAVYVWDAPHAFFHQTFCRADALAFGALVASVRAQGSFAQLRRVFLVLGGSSAVVLVGLFLYWRCLAARSAHAFHRVHLTRPRGNGRGGVGGRTQRAPLARPRPGVWLSALLRAVQLRAVRHSRVDRARARDRPPSGRLHRRARVRRLGRAGVCPRPDRPVCGVEPRQLAPP